MFVHAFSPINKSDKYRKTLEQVWKKLCVKITGDQWFLEELSGHETFSQHAELTPNLFPKTTGLEGTLEV